MKILIADDDQISLMMMRRMLLQSGYDVTIATDGISAVDAILRADGPRLLLLDWMMPGLSGPEVCRAIRASAARAYVYIVLLTAKDSKDDLVAGLEAGADDYLTKPCHSEELRARLRTGQRILELEDSLIEAREEMRYRATHDALTSLLNRGTIVHTLADKLQNSGEAREDISVVLCDVDHFKSINDTYGHPVGDEVLREVARRFKATTRMGDALGRYGGEEFLFMLRNCTSDCIASRTAEICEVIRSTEVETSCGPLRVTISAGAISISSYDFSAEPDQILQRADLLLYSAKREGRDRFVTDFPQQPGLLVGESFNTHFLQPALL